MTQFLEILMGALATITLDNVIFTAAVGTSTLLECTRKPRQMVSFGLFIGTFSILSSIVTYFLEPLLMRNEITALFAPMCYILTLGIFYVLILLFIWKFLPRYFKYLSRYVHLTAFNCASLGCLFMNSLSAGTLLDRVIFAACVGLGFMLATYLLVINRRHLHSNEAPMAFRGFPLSILYIGIISMIIYACNM